MCITCKTGSKMTSGKVIYDILKDASTPNPSSDLIFT